MEEANDELGGVLGHINFNVVINNKRKVPDADLKRLILHFNQPQFVLLNDNFEFPDLLGAAYEYLIKHFADSAGKKGGQFHTPPHVARLMVQLLKPAEGISIYDPTAGSGGKWPPPLYHLTPSMFHLVSRDLGYRVDLEAVSNLGIDCS